MRIRRSLLIAASILYAGSAAFAQQPSPADIMAITLQQDHFLTTGVAGPILDNPLVSDADKELVRNALKPVEDALATMKKDAAANPSMEQIQADQQAVTQASEAITKLLETRMDFYWPRLRADGVGRFETQMMQSNPADLVALMKAAGADDTQVAKARVIIDRFKADADNFQKQGLAGGGKMNLVDQMALATAFSEKSLAAIKDINALLTPQQRFDLEWAVAKPLREDGDDKPFFILGFASQPTMILAPEDGNFLLESTGGDMKAEPKPLASVTLKKGDTIGFKKTGKATTASAADKSFDVPADTITRVFWELSPKKP